MEFESTVNAKALAAKLYIFVLPLAAAPSCLVLCAAIAV
jgi:hypothetical protein